MKLHELKEEEETTPSILEKVAEELRKLFGDYDMKLDELEEGEREEECCDPEDDENPITPALIDCLHHLDSCLKMMERVRIKGKKVTFVPKHMTDVMEEASEFLEEYELT